jgi:hypothetical protein
VKTNSSLLSKVTPASTKLFVAAAIGEAMMKDDSKVKHRKAALPFMVMPTYYRI